MILVATLGFTKKLSYRRGTARARYVSWNLVKDWTLERKVPFKKACNTRMLFDVLQGHWHWSL